MMADDLKLFDDSHREDLDPAKYTESRWKYLNRTARVEFQYIREVLQQWFDEYDAIEEKRHSLRKEFRSNSDEKHLSAFFELYLYKLFKKQGFEIEVEPEWQQGRPDFLLTAPSGEKILLEATGTYPRRWYGAEEKQELTLIDYLNERINSPDFFLQIETINNSNRTPPLSRLLRDIQEQLDELQYEQVVDNLGSEVTDLSLFPSISWQDEYWKINFLAIPKKEEARGKVGLRPIAARFQSFELVDSVSSIKSRISSKNAHYGEIAVPYILAVNISDRYADQESLLDALFGQETVSFNTETGETKQFREPNGVWIGPKGIKNQRMSSICIFKGLLPENMYRVDTMIWHHLSPTIPLNPHIISLSQQIWTSGKYEARNGTKPSHLLELDEARMPK